MQIGDRMESKAENLFYKGVIILIELYKNGESIVSDLYRHTNMTYSHVNDTVRTYEKIGLIATKKKGRVKICYLTDKGFRIASLIEKIERILKEDDDYESKE